MVKQLWLFSGGEKPKKETNMKIGKFLSMTAAAAMVVTTAYAGTSKMDFAKVYEKECQGCHGPIHQGGVGSDLRPKVLKKKNTDMMAETILNGRPGTAMPSWKHMFSKDDAYGMIDWLMNWKNTMELKLSLDDIKKKLEKTCRS